MKMRKSLILAMAVLLLTGCGDSTSAEKETNNEVNSTEVKEAVDNETVETDEVPEQERKGYIGTFGEDVFFTGIDDYVGCEFDITMIYEAKDMEGKYVFNALEKTEEGSMIGLFRVADQTDGKVLADTANYKSLDNLAVEMRVVLDQVVIYETEGSDEISIEYEVTAKEATFLPLDSIEAKLARSGYFTVGNTINYKDGLSINIVSVGYENIIGMDCVTIEVEAINTGSEDVYLPNPDFYGDNYFMERAYRGDKTDITNGMCLAPGRKVHGYYCARLGEEEYSVIEAELYDAIVMVQYTKSDMDDLSIYGAYRYDNGVDAVVDGDVGISVDTEENYIYLAVLYYGSNHYTVEISGTLKEISENTYSVKDKITGTVELEVIFVDGGMDVKVIASESDEYKVLEGHYDMTSQLDFSEVG
ncbi:MAG: hypothetical protein E7288_03825 [Lachnospiraceae bacterium]|nr:hypothetical protein [Lachnospiraceae bacterium]